MKFSVGDVIVDGYGHEGICLRSERCPARDWIAQQEDHRMSRAVGPWWNVLPFTGGAVIVPEDLGTLARRATVDDIARVMNVQQTKHAGEHTLIELFQHLQKEQNKRRSRRREC